MPKYSDIKVQALFRSHSHLPIWEVLEQAGIWRELGMNVNFEFCGSSNIAERALFDGSVAFVSGNHITPYALVAQGKPIVCLASPSNLVRDRLVSRVPLSGVFELRGKRLGDTTLVDPAGGYHHLRGNHMLYVMRTGLQLEEVEWVEIAETMDELRGAQVEDLRSGKIDATFVSGSAEKFQEMGFHVITPEPLPMVTGPTITTTLDNLQKTDGLGERLVEGMIRGIHFVQTHPQETERILDGLKRRVPEAKNVSYSSVAKLLPKPYPTPEAVQNAYRLCCMKEPKAWEVSPLALWDLHYLRQLDHSGLIERLYS